MVAFEIERGINRITGATMHFCKFGDGTLCLIINGINVKTGEKAESCTNIF